MGRWSRQIWGALAIATLVVVLIAWVKLADAHRMRHAIIRADPNTILDQPEIAQAALSLGHQGFVAHCASCHGVGRGDQARGIPDLTDGDHLYGSGQVDEIEQIILHGIRSGDPRGWQLASMPAYARAKPYGAEPIPPMSPAQIRDVVQFLMIKHGVETDRPAAARGAKFYAGSGGCYDCHATDGGGDEAIGAPNLLDDAWLYGSSPAALTRTIMGGRAGASLAFSHVLSPVEARTIAVYVAALSHHRKQDSAHD